MELTVGDVRRGKIVIHEDTIGFSHFQVDHVWGIFQGSHGMLMGNFLQTGAIHLRHTKRHTDINLFNKHTLVNNRQQTASLQQEVCLLSAASHLCVQLHLQ